MTKQKILDEIKRTATLNGGTPLGRARFYSETGIRESDWMGKYKIGKTNALGRREYELAIQLPERTNTVHAIKTDGPAGIESYWHTRFQSKRRNGEWFALDASDIKAFRRRKFM